jgi:phospholipid/cholesterol/gamma-HCH transport system substrate-binding protein
MIKRRRRIQGSVLVAFMLVCAGIFVLLLHIAGGTNLAAKYDVDAVVPDAVQLVPGAVVREAGVDVGIVSKISNNGDTAVLKLALSKKYSPIYEDATVRVATKTLVGENYIDLNPGTRTSGAIIQNGTLSYKQARGGVQLDQILSTFTPARQKELRTLLAGFGGGLSNGGGQALNQTLDALSGTINNAAPANFVGNFSSVLGALSERSTQIHEFVTAGTQAAVTVAARDKALEADLRTLPTTISTVQRVTKHLAGVGTNADPVLDNLGDALGNLTPALKTLPSAGAATLSALDKLKAVTPVASRLVTTLKNTAPSIANVVPPLARVVDQLRPLVSYISPYAKGLDYLLYDMDSVGQVGDKNGLFAALLPLFSAQTIQTLSASDRQLINQLIGNTGLAGILEEKGVNAYPGPGTATNPQPLTTTYPELKPDTGG